MDRNKVIKGLEICMRVMDNENCPNQCPYRKDICYGTAGLMADALALIKEQHKELVKLQRNKNWAPRSREGKDGQSKGD